MSVDPLLEVPTTLETLACLAADAALPDSQRNAVFAQLLPRIQTCAQQIARRFPAERREELCNHAPHCIWQHLGKFDPSRGTFTVWCRVQLFHCFRELLRAPAHALTPLTGDELVAPEQGFDVAKWKAALVRQRQILDRIGWLPKTRAGIDLFAVFLLRCRLGVARRMAATWVEVGHQVTGRASDFIAGLAPWRSAEESRGFKLGWPPLGEVWAKLEPGLNTPPHKQDGTDVCRLLQICRAAPEPDLAVWNAWVNRGKAEARQRMTQPEWTECFALLFPDRQGSGLEELPHE